MKVISRFISQYSADLFLMSATCNKERTLLGQEQKKKKKKKKKPTHTHCVCCLVFIKQSRDSYLKEDVVKTTHLERPSLQKEGDS